MKKAIMTIAVGDDPMFEYTIRTIRKYAEKVGADFILKDKALKNIKLDFTKRAWLLKFKISELLKKYDRVLFLDADILIRPDAENIFNEYPDTKTFYALNEGAFTNRQPAINSVKNLYNNVTWPQTDGKDAYYNAGVMLFSKQIDFVSQGSIKQCSTDFKNIQFIEQTYFNYLIGKTATKHASLDPKYNWMSCVSESKERLDGYFIHYAGNGYIRRKLRHKLIYADYQTLYGKEPKLKNLMFAIRSRLFLITRIFKKIFRWATKS